MQNECGIIMHTRFMRVKKTEGEKRKGNYLKFGKVIMSIVGNPLCEMFTRVRAGGYLIKKQERVIFG